MSENGTRETGHADFELFRIVKLSDIFASIFDALTKGSFSEIVHSVNIKMAVEKLKTHFG